ncbi:hypothetical protein UT300003_02560 [Clostridium sardiniense]|nr:hypothetical protein [Clostridium sardiniense]MBM7833518.1 hydroxylamine reductase (hybrid-cluster protein) [Clostridium sardiniense]
MQLEKERLRTFLIGSCDGACPGRNYYREMAQKVPEDDLKTILNHQN